MRWTQISHAQHEQFVTVEELRMLHHLCEVIPSDLRLTNDGHCYIVVGDCKYAQMASWQTFLGTWEGGPLSIVFSACIKNMGVGVEVAVECRPCSHAGCSSVVARSCPACNDICSSCQRDKHAKNCCACTLDVCLTCIVPDVVDEGIQPDETQLLCTACGFQCFVCFVSMQKKYRFACAAGADCRTPNRPCTSCVFEANALPLVGCQGCDKLWCAGGCRQDPECAACDFLICQECSDLTQCVGCNLQFHRNWEMDLGCIEACDRCDVFKCEDCSDFVYCESCDANMCLACRPVFSCSIDDHADTCRECVEICRKLDIQWGGGVDTNCWYCFSEAYAELRGFTPVGEFFIDDFVAPDASKALLACPQLKSTRAQYWLLGGRIRKWEYGSIDDKFDTCSSLWSDLQSMTEGLYDDDGPRPLEELLTGLRLEQVAMSFKDPFVHRVSSRLSIENQGSVRATMHLKSSTPEAFLHPNSLKLELSAEANEDEALDIASVHIRECYLNEGRGIISLRVVTSKGQETSFGWEGPDPEHSKQINWTVPAGSRLVGFFGGMCADRLRYLGVVVVAVGE